MQDLASNINTATAQADRNDHQKRNHPRPTLIPKKDRKALKEHCSIGAGQDRSQALDDDSIMSSSRGRETLKENGNGRAVAEKCEQCSTMATEGDEQDTLTRTSSNLCHCRYEDFKRKTYLQWIHLAERGHHSEGYESWEPK